MKILLDVNDQFEMLYCYRIYIVLIYLTIKCVSVTLFSQFTRALGMRLQLFDTLILGYITT